MFTYPVLGVAPNLLSGLLAWYPLEEDGVNLVDAHSNGPDMRPLTGRSVVATGKVGDCQDGNTNTKMRVATTDTDSATLRLSTDAFTIAGWLYIDTLNPSGTTSGQWVDRSSGAGGYTLQQIQDGGTDERLVFRVNTADRLYSNEIVVASTWYHFIAEYDYTDTATKSLQINGGTTASHTTGQMIDQDVIFVAFASWYTGTGLDCKIDELAFWNRVLTTAEKALLYNGGTGMTYSDI